MKRASLNLSLEQVIGLVIGSIVILGLIFFAVSLTGLIVGKPDQSTLNSFEQLSLAVNQLVNFTGKEPVALEGFSEKTIMPVANSNRVQAIIPISLEDNYAIIGFDGEKVKQTCMLRDPDLSRPTQCLSPPCLCLAHLEGLVWHDAKFVSCNPIKNVRYISAVNSDSKKYNLGTEHGKGVAGDYLALWSGCNSPVVGVKNIKVIKTPAGNDFDLFFEIPASEK